MVSGSKQGDRSGKSGLPESGAIAAGSSSTGTGADSVVQGENAASERSDSVRGRPPVTRMDSILAEEEEEESLGAWGRRRCMSHYWGLAGALV